MKLPFNRIRNSPRKGGWTDLHIHAMDNTEAVGRFGITWMVGHIARTLYPDAETWAHTFKRDPAEYETWVEFYIDKPIVSYVRVEPTHQRQRLGTNLYLEGASWMAEYGLGLIASDQRNENSLALWSHMLSDPKIPTFTLPDGRHAICKCARLNSGFFSSLK